MQNSISHLHIYPSTFKYETRILKQTKSLINNDICNYIEIASIWENGLPILERLDDNRTVRRFKLPSYFSTLNVLNIGIKYFQFYLITFFYYRKHKFDFVNCHSLLVLFIGVLLKKFGKSKYLVYDTHELETERVGLSGFTKKILKFFENYFLRYVDKIVVVSEPIAQWYRNEYLFKEVYTVCNFPTKCRNLLSKTTYFRDVFNIPNCDLIFLYQGVLTEERGIVTLIDLFIKLPFNKHIVFMGYGKLEYKIKDLSIVYKNIHFHSAVQHSELLSCTCSADVGINYIPGNLCLSYQYSLPNKFGEYILSNLPVIVSSNLTYLSGLINDKKCGWVIDCSNEDNLYHFINNLNNNDVSKIRNNVISYSNEIGWDHEESIYIKVFK